MFTMLADAATAMTDADKIDKIYTLLTSKLQGFNTVWWLCALNIVVVVVILMRQKKIAQNQVDLAKMMEQVLDKK